jgi:hypothetical protein
LIAARKIEEQVVAGSHVLNRLAVHPNLSGDTVVGTVWSVFELLGDQVSHLVASQMPPQILFLRANAPLCCSDNPARTMVGGGSHFLRSSHAR